MRLYFNLIFVETAFDSIIYIAHFRDEFSGWNWVFPLHDHKERTLTGIFKRVILECEKLGMPISAFVLVIHMDQEQSVGTRLQNWVERNGIRFEWSSRYTPEQNRAAERSGAILTEKARYIRIHGKLPAEMSPECYLASGYLLNHTPSAGALWDSPKVILQKALKNVPFYDLTHMKIYGCKAYPLLKGLSKPANSEKLKPRAFIGYLVGYDSSNIYRIWDPEKGEVSGYRDVIFNEDEFFDTYKKEDLLQEKEIREIVDFTVYEPLPYVQDVDSDEEEWVAMPPRLRPVEPSLPTLPSVTTNTLKPVPDKTPAPSPNTPYTPLTPAETPKHSPPPPPPPPSSTQPTGGLNIQIDNRRKVVPPVEPPAEPADDLPVAISTEPRRRGRPKGKTVKLPPDLPPTGDTPLDAVRPSKGVSADFNTDHIIDTKRPRKPPKHVG